jgi:dTDP-4-amino-4,6-dideoxygalactose transaminase
MIKIPFNLPTVIGNEFAYIQTAISEYQHLSGDGHFTRMSQAFIERHLAIQKSLLTTSCTDALEMAAMLLDLQPGDEVIVPDFTFVSTANAFVLHGATPVFVDIRRDTLNLDENLLEAAITPRTRAIIPVHYAGVACEMNAILELASQHGITVIEDNAHGLFAQYHGANLGTLGHMSTLSFHETKNISCGEGGALLIRDAAYNERAEVIRNKGTNRQQFLQGQVDKYTWVDIGSSFLMSDLSAAFLFAQLENYAAIQQKRQQLWDFYFENLQDLTQKYGVQLPTVPDYCTQSFHLFYLITRSLDERQQLISYLAARGIQAVFHYQPLHLSQMGERFGGMLGNFPATGYVSERIVRLPFFYGLTEKQQTTVVEAIHAFYRTTA